MKKLLLTMLVAVAIEVPATNPIRAGGLDDDSKGRPPGTIVVVAGARQDRHGVATNRIVSDLTAELGPWQSVQVVRFDAEPVLQNEYTVEGANRDLVVVKPRTPLKDAMEAGLLALITIPGPRGMIIVAHDQLYPSIVSADRLWDLARQWDIQVHTIYLGSNANETAVRRLARRMRNVFNQDSKEHGESPRDTRRFLHLMADVTGGEACVANDEATGIAAANAIAVKVLKTPGRGPLDSRSECVPWLAELSANRISPAAKKCSVARQLPRPRNSFLKSCFSECTQEPGLL
jgi:hypothetical protein